MKMMGGSRVATLSMPMLALTIAIFGSACGGDSDRAASDNIVSIGIGEPKHLVPSNTTETEGHEVVSALFAPLVEYDEESRPYEVAAESITSTDNQTWTIKLRAGWMVVSGEKRHARDYIEGLNMLASMRLCSNTPGQLAIQTALGGYQSIKELVSPGGRLCRQRDLAYDLLTQIPGVSVVKPKAALYMFPRLDPKMYPIADDQQLAYELLAEEKVLIVQGTGFNWPHPDHFRLVFLPNSDDLTEAVERIARFLDHYRRRHTC